MRALRNLLCIAVGFAVAAMVASIGTRPRSVSTVTEKLARYAEAADEYDVLAIGSSLTYRQIIPRVFDDTARTAGQPMRLYNLGVDGMSPPEDTYVLEKALALRKTPLAVALVECNRLRFKLRPQDENTVRAIYWHDGKRLATLARFALSTGENELGVWDRTKHLGETLPILWRHLDYWFRNVTALGRGHEMLLDLLLQAKQETDELGADGYDAPPPRDGISPEDLRRFQEAVAELRTKPMRYDRGDPVSRAELEEKRRLIARAGARMILVVPPDPIRSHFLPADESAYGEVLDFSDPNEFPELYDPTDRRDSGHFNVRGAEIYTRIIALRVSALLEERP